MPVTRIDQRGGVERVFARRGSGVAFAREGYGGTDPQGGGGAGIRDTPEVSDAQRDEWLLKTELLKGARPRREDSGRPPVIIEQMGVADIEAAGGGGAFGRKVEQRGAPIPTLLPEQRSLQEEEVRTPPRREAHGHGGHRAPEPQLPPGGTRVVPQIFANVRPRDVGPDRRSDCWSPVNVLEDTVA